MKKKEKIAPPFFIVGTGRSGTQMLRNILNCSQDIVVLPETHFITVLYNKYSLNKIYFDDFFDVIDNIYDDNGEKWIKVILKFTNKKYENFYSDLKLYNYKENKKEKNNIKKYLENLFTFLHGENKIFGDKTPHYGSNLKIIKKIWPNAKIIHITRNGIDCSFSMLRHPAFVKFIANDIKAKEMGDIMYGKNLLSLNSEKINIYKALNFWNDNILSIFKESENINSNDIIKIKYEDVTCFPQETILKIINFLDLPSADNWVKKAIELPHPFSEQKHNKSYEDSKYYEYYEIIKEGMEKANYKKNNVKIKRNFKNKLKEVWRGRKYYINKINFINIIKKIKNYLK